MHNIHYSSAAIRCVIIDDDPFIQDLLQDKLAQYFPSIEVLGTFGSGQEGLNGIKRLQPNLVFLDVEMADMTGFEMLSRTENIDFRVIFITSYKHYAIKAIRFNALDYLLKPFDIDELKAAIKRFTKSQSSKKMPTALHNLKSAAPSDQTLILNTQNGELFLPLKDIIHIDGDRNYSNIYITHNRKELVSKNLSQLEELLNDKGFFRCHKSHIVNKGHITSTLLMHQIELSNQIIIPISRRKKEAFKKWLNN